MRVTVYHEPRGGSLGGAEVVSAVVAHALRGPHAVEVVHHLPDLSADRLAAFAEVDLAGVAVRHVPWPERKWFAADAPPWRLGRELRAWQAELSRGCDLFVASVHGVPPFCHAKAGGLYVHFPAWDRRAAWPWSTPPRRGVKGLADRLRRGLHERLWRERMAGYGVRLANSRFTADHTRGYWGVDCEVLPPPIRTAFPDVPKRDAVAVLGRFTPRKRQLDVVKAFRQSVAPRAPGWELVCVGTVGRTPDEADYFREVQAAAAGGPVRLVADAPADVLRQELAAAKVFWHASGLGHPPGGDPFLLEHFGMATAEAMAAGCVPAVAARGGQVEIVTDGENGFLCESEAAMADRTLAVAADDGLRVRLAAAARARAAEFSTQRFIDGVRNRFAGVRA